ncbi:DNA polymerase III subunit beta [Streptomyces sp. ZS0098]|uniref:DNA polymerase III subunit beta family protein n=1 Tax=Streptomyces sp. ZS0098 TaxID=1904044 RepID=UPI000EFC29E6|nr:MerR family transcriptional regulator [Streptomyces sp. ZS0098]RMI93157.1 DNA polymerase III subunit beta [Streptomyces sp. ZS0098]
MRSIGEMARVSGLGVSALRFYDRAGILVPDRVDPVTGYRWYAPEQLGEARVLARLRRAGMPLADVRLVLAGWTAADTDLVRRLLEAHLRRLQEGLSAARVEFSALRDLLDDRENPLMTSPRSAARLSVSGPGLAAALDAVRFAAGTDPELPVLAGVHLDAEGDALHAVATDRYRMAVARAAVGGHGGGRVRATVPLPLVDAMRALLDGEDEVSLAVDDGRVTLEAGDRQTGGRCMEQDFPDYRRLVRLPAGRRAEVDVPAFAEAVRTGLVRLHEDGGTKSELTVLEVSEDGRVAPVPEGADGPDLVAVNRAFLLDALDAAADDRLVLEFGAPTTPLAIRGPGDEHTFSLLMPVRLSD